MIFILKKDGTQQMCVYHRALNKITIENKYPLPSFDGLFDQFHGACVLFKINFQSG
jgi:hypothetical protein